jgi:S1-C subfamily serine protease
MRRFFRTSFGSALLGGAVVAAFGWIAIAAGWIDAQGDSTATVVAPLATPVVNKESGDANVVNQIYRHDGQGVAFIESTEAPEESSSPLNPFGEGESSGGGIATGSGIVIDTAGHVLTNNHVVEGATKIEVKLGSSNASHTAEVVVNVGDPVVAIGNPFGLDRTVTAGIVSALQRQIQAPNGFSISHVIQTDAAINPGNSGGPLIDAGGNVIGINSQIETGGGGNGNVGIGFAIPINTAHEVVDEIEKNGKVEHAFLGVSGGTITPALANAVNLPVSKGVLLAEVVKGGPADKAGLEGGSTEATIEGAKFELGGDIITEVAGEPITSMEDVINAVNSAKPGDKIELTILRHGETKKVTVTLGNRPVSTK